MKRAKDGGSWAGSIQARCKEKGLLVKQNCIYLRLEGIDLNLLMHFIFRYIFTQRHLSARILSAHLSV